jgi:peroxiredoxin
VRDQRLSSAARGQVLWAVSCALVMVGLTEAQAAKFNRVLDIGSQAPAWNNLPGTDGQRHALADLKSADVVVVVFFCNHCPVAKAYEKRLLELAEATKKQSVRMVLISVSRYEADRLEEMKNRATDRKYPFPYLQDVSQKLGLKYGAYVTPQVFVLDHERTIAYMGAIDDSMDPAEVTQHYLKDAISAVLGKRQLEVEETRPVGCHIEFED